MPRPDFSQSGFDHSQGIFGVDRGDSPPLTSLEFGFIHYNVPFFVGNLAIANYTGYDATDFDRGRWGSSLVTVWIGSSPYNKDMPGHMPDLITFNERGERLGVYHGTGHRVGAGGIYQFVLRNEPDAARQNPTYLRVYAGGYDAVCLTAVLVSGYGGFAAMWTADTMIGCTNYDDIHKLLDDHGNQRVGYEENYAQIQGVRPRCLWLDRDSSYGLKVKGVDLHIPSLIATPEKQQAYLLNPDLLCNRSPRMNTARYTLDDNNNRPLYWSARIFNPPLQFVKNTLLDMIPERILQWRPTMDQIGPKILVEDKGRAKSEEFWIENLREKPADKKKRQLLTVVPSERKLVISKGSISAKRMCRVDGDYDDIGDGSDYLSLSEKIYCDIILKTSYPMCDDMYDTYCFDTDMMMLRSHGAIEDDLVLGNTTAGRMLVARDALAPPLVAPLFGIPYSSIISIS